MKGRVTNANIMGLSRLAVLTPLSASAIFHGMDVLAGVLILLSGLTDLLDGKIARHEKTVSNFGIFLDLTSDKVLAAAVLVAFVTRGLVPAWAVALILAREFVVMGIRCYASAEGQIIGPDRLGGAKIIATFVATCALAFQLPFAIVLFYAALGLTLMSGVHYLHQVRDLLLRDLYYDRKP